MRLKCLVKYPMRVGRWVLHEGRFNRNTCTDQYVDRKGQHMHYLLTYTYTDDYLEKRAQFRNEHLSHAWAAQRRGELILGGAVGDPADSAVLVFSCSSAELIEAFVKADPYYRNGLVRNYSIRLWTTVVGEGAYTPVYPS